MTAATTARARENDRTEWGVSTPPRSPKLCRRQERYAAARMVQRDLEELTDLDEPVLAYEPCDPNLLRDWSGS